MKINYLKLAVIILIGYLLYGCSESSESTNVGKRIVYICSFSPVWSWNTYSDLFSFDIMRGELKKINTNIFSYSSGISKDGKIVFEYSGEMEFGYWVLLSDNTLLPIPLPETTDSLLKYGYSFPRIQLSYNGNLAVFGTNLHQSENYEIGINKLVFMNMQNLTYNIYDIENQFYGKFSSPEITDFIPARSISILNNEGTTFWFVYSGRNVKDINYSDLETRIFKFDGKNLKANSRILKGDVCIVGADYINEKIFVRHITNYDTTIFAVDNFNDSIPLNLPKRYFTNPEQFAKEQSEMAVWNDDGIAIYDLNSMSLKQNVISWSKFNSLFPGYKSNEYREVTISPDGEYLTFFLKGNYYFDGYDVFIIRRDGTELKRIYKEALVWNSVISGIIQ
ncbi:MAG: hypothetical protein HZB41_15515 [Ignavibacteriae bacterium]|nr:hypothetical protein [Ignavibacteriota bacterium]